MDTLEVIEPAACGADIVRLAEVVAKNGNDASACFVGEIAQRESALVAASRFIPSMRMPSSLICRGTAATASSVADGIAKRRATLCAHRLTGEKNAAD